ncbi:methylated-DNA--[protein]-cysteine S-methyltransferase [Magnetospira sp. QH-2]|uniref:methylated-DNA--[protein]-cysteine S-methyltransferase n=1 Tax=Magnetospira sp. (strain QH-2) TaxID=1288970 RepID=UPI0003E80FA4|nr:methylated-DNA--[protein]-cysteine S-methyltransferase [Magnetospira sp. QH-2]CCQ75615.1 Methylated-DNA--protein-cysteine methyltransferase [Magnetospira sp. QH-2]
MAHLSFHSPVGSLTLFEEDGLLVALDWGRVPECDGVPAVLGEAKRQLDAYFEGDLQDFDLPLEPRGTEFQRRVWSEMQRIPFGEVRTYGDLAYAIGSGPRAVGGACGRNPLPIVIPCHRVTGANNRLTGYSGGQGLDTKRRLLAFEGLRFP